MSEDAEGFRPSPTWKFWRDKFGSADKPNRPFTFLEQYVHLDDLPEQQAREVRDFIEKLYSVSGASWGPGRCRNMAGIASWAHDILQENKDNFTLIKQLQLKRYVREHFWIELEVEGLDQSVIIDPAGVPVDSMKKEQNIIPHFGLLKDAKSFAQRVYKNKENYDGTTRPFPPGFSP